MRMDMDMHRTLHPPYNVFSNNNNNNIKNDNKCLVRIQIFKIRR